MKKWKENTNWKHYFKNEIHIVLKIALRILQWDNKFNLKKVEKKQNNIYNNHIT